MRLRIRHETAYCYERPARSAIQVLRLTPRNDANQFVRRWRVEIDADARLHRDEDAYGNITHVHSIEGPIESLKITVDGEVETSDNAGFIHGAVERLPARYYLGGTRLTEINADLRRFAAELLAAQGGDRLAFLHELMLHIHTDWRFDTDATTTVTTAADTFSAKAGVCQDFAHLFVATARAAEIPARYAGGYFLLTDTETQQAGHAWAEAFVDGLGWLGFDAANGQCIGDRFVRVAVGRDYLEAAPVRGTRSEGAGETLTTSVHVSRGARVIGQ